MANQDFTTWTEADTTGLLSVTSSTVTATSLNGQTSAAATLYKSHGTDFFDGDFTFRLGPVEFTSADELASIALLLVSTVTQYTGVNNPGAYPCIALRWQGILGSSKTLYLYQYTTTDTPVASDSYTGTAVGLNTPFYVELQRSGSTATAKIYSDAYSTLVDTLSISLTTVASYEYTIIGKWHSGSGAALSGTIQNLDLEASSGGGATASTKMAFYRMLRTA